MAKLWRKLKWLVFFLGHRVYSRDKGQQRSLEMSVCCTTHTSPSDLWSKHNNRDDASVRPTRSAQQVVDLLHNKSTTN